MRENTVRLGLMPPLTGLVGMYGAGISRAGQIACDEVNESGGVLGKPLELVIEDDGSLPESAVAAATRLVDRHRCVALIGNLLSNSRIAVAYQVAEPRKIPYLNFSFYEGSILSHYFFHFAALPNQQIDRMIPYMRNQFGPRMFFADNNYEWPRGSIDAAKRALEQASGQIVGEEYYPIGVSDSDIERLLDHVAESEADVFVPYFAGADQVHLLTRFTERGLKNRMAVVMGHYDEAMASRLPPEVREGFYSSNTYFMTLDTPENREYLARLARQPGVDGIWPQGNGILTNFGEGAYLCVKAFAKAANQAGSLDPEALIEALETVNVSGPQGVVQMDPATHHAQVNTYLSRCEADGSFTVIERFDAIPPVLPERYRHLRISKQAGLEDIYLQSRMLAQMTEAVLLVYATDGVIVYANPGAERMFGYGSGELADKRFSELFAPSGKPPEEIAASIGAVLSHKGVWHGETEHITRDGRRFWCAASISVFTHPKYGEVWMIQNRDITERKQAEEQLRTSETLLRRTQELAAIGSWRLNMLKNELVWSDETYRIFGIPAGTPLAYESFLTNVHPDDKELVDSAWYAALKGAPYQLQHRIVVHGETRWVEEHAELDFDAQGNLHSGTGSVQDITERKRAENELHAASLYARSLIEASLDPLVTISAKGKVTDVNKATEETTGLSRSELIGTDFADYFTEPEKARAGYRQVFDQGLVRDYPLTLRHRAGHQIDVLYNATIYRDEAGNIMGVFAAARDITERKRTEEAIRISQSRFNTIFNQAPLGIALIDSFTGSIYEVNPRFAEITGRTTEEMMAIDWMSITHPDDVQEDLDNMALLNTGKISSFNMDKRYMRPDGSFVWINMTIAPLRVEQNVSSRHLCMIDDISERKLAETRIQKLTRLYATLSQTNKAIVRSTNRQELFCNICKAAVEHGKFVLAWVGLVDEATHCVNPVCHHGTEQGYLANIFISVDDIPAGRGPAGTAIRENRVWYINSFTTDERALPWRDAALKRGYQSSVGLPLRLKGKVVGVLTMYSGEPDFFDTEQLDLMEEMSGDISFALDGVEREVQRRQAEEERGAALVKLRKALEDSVQIAASMTEVRDPYTSGHQQRVSQLAAAIAVEMGLSEAQVKGIHFGSLVHDIGKVGVPAEILSKPSHLTPLEMELIHIHPQAGYEIVKDIEFPWPVAQMIMQHHERLDGSGYPARLKSDDIIIEAKIIAVADTVEAMSSHRPYRPELGMDAALEEIASASGTRYDKQAVEACLRLIREKGFTFNPD